MPATPAPEGLPDFKTRMAPYKEMLGDWYDRPRPIDIRYVDGGPFERKGTTSSSQRVWMRADGELPNDPLLHQCIVTYASDMTLLDTALAPHGRTLFEKEFMAASLDHVSGIGGQNAAMAALGAPIYTRPAAQTLGMLTNMPYLATANIATMRLGASLSMGGGAALRAF